MFPAADSSLYSSFEAALLARHGSHVFARDGETVDEIVAGLLLGPPVRTIAVAESCTGGLMAARLTDRAGSSAYAVGGIVAYSNAAKTALVGVPEELIARNGAVSPEVASALAAGAVSRFGSDLGDRHHRGRRSGRRVGGQAGRDRLPLHRGPRRRAGGAHRAPAGRPRDRP